MTLSAVLASLDDLVPIDPLGEGARTRFRCTCASTVLPKERRAFAAITCGSSSSGARSEAIFATIAPSRYRR
eukprot:CAMPEP_0180169260 /NCGR_PEP_ID=MMETSP0986-20121125/33167_1 /TAXON_ID=697907 /ORGANISM="non described non described, Strain CCMP2293" /LENGTH=71 /DNA_ID=CAMNT_0022120809 /DNA_START=156 /DNA_END=367 /DNA_ORIENTATION=-